MFQYEYIDLFDKEHNLYGLNILKKVMHEYYLKLDTTKANAIMLLYMSDEKYDMFMLE
jgi:hypothetical protein